jgi:hypothetical protein
MVSKSKTPFPAEVLNLIFAHNVSPHDLSSLSRVNHVFHSEAVRVLYRSISLQLPPDLSLGHISPITCLRRHVLCLKSLCEVDNLASLVRVLAVSWRSGLQEPTRNLFFLLNQALRRLRGLTSLSVGLPYENMSTFNYIFDGCSFSLTQFTLAKFHPSIIPFLERQSKISRLTIVNVVHYDFDLDPLALPRLNHLTVGMVNGSVLTSLVRGRPVKSLQFSAWVQFKLFDALKLSTGPIQLVSVLFLTFDTPPLDSFLGEAVDCLPCLTMLRIGASRVYQEVCRLYYHIEDL